MIETNQIVDHFRSLAEQWKAQTSLLSSTTAMLECPAYRAIISIGWPVMLLLLQDLAADSPHWFEALQAISGVNPVPREHWGNISAMRADWLEWGRREGLIF
jgi:hypothetical protein